MIKISKVLLFFSFVVLSNIIFCPEVSAVTITINSFPAEINSLDNFQITASVSGATNATNYLRVDLYKDGTSNYFGETYNGSDWYSGGEGKSYLPVQIQNSSASATLFGQFGNPNSNQYPGPGAYKLKIRRYTSSGSASSNDTQTPVDVQITYVIPTPTPEPTPEPTNPPTPTSFPTPTPIQIKTPTPVPTPTPTKTPTPKPSPTETPEVLGMASDSGITENVLPYPPASSAAEVENQFPLLAVVLVGSGVILIGVSLYLAYKKQRENTDIIGR